MGTAPGFVPPRAGSRRTRARVVRDLGPGDERARTLRGGRSAPDRGCPRPALDTRGLRLDEVARASAVGSQLGRARDLNDGLAWGLLPIFYAASRLSVGEIGLLAATYPAVWGAGQLITEGLSDRLGRKGLIVGGMLLQAAALAMIPVTHGLGSWLVAGVLLGAGTAMVYPTLLAVICDVAHPRWRASAVASTDCGATSASPLGRFWPASSPTGSGCRRRSGSSLC
jgi:hypothetical protein